MNESFAAQSSGAALLKASRRFCGWTSRSAKRTDDGGYRKLMRHSTGGPLFCSSGVVGPEKHVDAENRSGAVESIRAHGYPPSASDELNFFNQPGDGDEDDGTNEGDDDGTDDAGARQDAEPAKQPATNKAAENAEKDVHQHAVAAAFHDDTREPARYEAHKDRDEESHFVSSFEDRIWSELGKIRTQFSRQ